MSIKQIWYLLEVIMKKIIPILLLILLVSGCSNSSQTVKTQSELSKQPEQIIQQLPVEAKISPSFPTKKYDTPFIEFLYPADWVESKENNYPNLIIALTNSKNNWDYLFIDKLNTEYVNLEDVIKNTQLSIYFDTKIINEGYLNPQCYYFEYYTNYNPVTHDKKYFYQSKDSFYRIGIGTEDSRWNDLQELVQVFEQSLIFK